MARRMPPPFPGHPYYRPPPFPGPGPPPPGGFGYGAPPVRLHNSEEDSTSGTPLDPSTGPMPMPMPFPPPPGLPPWPPSFPLPAGFPYGPSDPNNWSSSSFPHGPPHNLGTESERYLSNSSDGSTPSHFAQNDVPSNSGPDQETKGATTDSGLPHSNSFSVLASQKLEADVANVLSDLRNASENADFESSKDRRQVTQDQEWVNDWLQEKGYTVPRHGQVSDKTEDQPTCPTIKISVPQAKALLHRALMLSKELRSAAGGPAQHNVQDIKLSLLNIREQLSPEVLKELKRKVNRLHKKRAAGKRQRQQQWEQQQQAEQQRQELHKHIDESMLAVREAEHRAKKKKVPTATLR